MNPESSASATVSSCSSVAPSGAVGLGVSLQRQHRIPLVIAREDHCLGGALGGDAPCLGSLDVNEPGQQVHPCISGPHALPQVGGPVPVRIGRVACSEVVA